MNHLTRLAGIVAIGVILIAASVFAQDGTTDDEREKGGFFALRISPAVGLSTDDTTVEIQAGDERPLFESGAQVGLAVHLNASGVFQPTLNADFSGISYGVSNQTMTIASGGAGAVLDIPMGSRLHFFAFGEGGYFQATVDGETGTNPYYTGGAGLGFRILRGFSLNLEANYSGYYDLYSGIGAGISATIGGGAGQRPVRERNELPATPETLPNQPVQPTQPTQPTQPGRLDGSAVGLQVSSVELTDIFPVLFRYYNETPIGTATFVNTTGEEIRDLVVRFTVPEFMTASRVSAEIDAIGPGEEKQIDIYALFTDKVLDLTEGSTVSATLSYDFSMGGHDYGTEQVLSLEFKNRNAITWDDDRKAAVFVTAQDEDVLRFSRNVASVISDSSIAALPREFQVGLAMHAAVSAHGVSYVIDPTTPYQELSSNTGGVDLLQFPRQTLQFKAGDCDDLSILFSSLMQAVGVDTAFVTIPGHIYVAFKLGITVEDARSTFLRSGDLIYRPDGTVWLPLEVTLIDEGFMEAWAVGARQYRDHYSDGTVGFYPISDAWKVYQPVTFRSTMNVALPGRDEILPAFREQLQRFVNREIYQQEQTLIARIQRDETPRYINRLGILYAKYGLKDKALEQFNRILEKQDYGPALLNVGNMYYLDNELQRAVGFYERAANAAPDNGAVLLAVARANFELENYGTVNRYYDRLISVDPDLANRFSFLSSNADISTRASDAAGMRGLVVWADEEDE